MGKPKQPELTPPGQTAAAQVSQNIGTALANAQLNNVNQYTADGSKVYDITGYSRYVDKSDPDNPVKYRIPQYSLTENLSPQQQAIKDQQDQTKLGLSTLANQQTGFLQDYMSKPFSYDAGEHEKWATGLYDKLNGDREQQQMSGLQTQLANSGIKLGSDAYDRAMESRSKSIEDARNQFALNSYQQGFGNAQATRNQPINEITALMSGGQVSMPQFSNANGYNIPTTDQAGITAQYDNARMQQWQAQMAQRQSLLGGLFSMGASLISDKRAKKDIEEVGSMKVIGDDGKPKTAGLFQYRYKWQDKSEPKHTGVMAQQLLKIKPSAVNVPKGGGLMSVDYSKVVGA